MSTFTVTVVVATPEPTVALTVTTPPTNPLGVKTPSSPTEPTATLSTVQVTRGGVVPSFSCTLK